MELLHLEHFSGCLGETFAAQLNGMEASFVLVEAQPLPGRAKDAMRAAFSLVFLNASPVLLPQQIYPMRHPRLGELGVFLVPVAQNRDGFLYQAVFN
ncbi:DUF6916 family protein [Luteimonas sp. SDU101]|uniref:DUF6916 family protein n=1 Tax=unclassified Luteimonas TaxID=2629088 RepID=UPI003EBE5F53